MPETPEWARYRVKIPTGSRRSFGDGVALETVHHIVHVPDARRILEDGLLRAGLVQDESRLRNSRTCVTWLSANTWSPGSIYGNVQFSFSWPDIIKKRTVYWVEAMTGYSPHAYRLLVTDRDLDGSRFVTRYDPESDQGPLRKRDGLWYWNPDYTSEFMVDADLKLGRCIAFESVEHHSTLCRHDTTCRDRGAPLHRTAGRIMAFILGNDIHKTDHVLKQPSVFDESRQLSDTVDVGIDGILRALGNKKDRFHGGIRNETSRQAVLKGALALYGADQRASARSLCALQIRKSV